ncbi:MAG: YbhB/YbcL family Raf kinase inhibitor-like protein [Methanosarcinales archaeon]|nr:YbhB/YbcL family Raf kinase inhibitor-like protein [Methanosarcinales archaeon]
MEKIQISSTAFKNGHNIPSRYTCDGKDISPQISWGELADGVASIALIMDDPDAPSGTFVHWVIYNISADIHELPEGIEKKDKLPDGTMQGVSDFGRAGIGYWGPCPPHGNFHHYYFKVYMLDTMLDLAPQASKKQLEETMKGHILAKGEIMGMYGRQG